LVVNKEATAMEDSTQIVQHLQTFHNLYTETFSRRRQFVEGVAKLEAIPGIANLKESGDELVFSFLGSVYGLEYSFDFRHATIVCGGHVLGESGIKMFKPIGHLQFDDGGRIWANGVVTNVNLSDVRKVFLNVLWSICRNRGAISEEDQS
jgi:hypothetical protein